MKHLKKNLDKVGGVLEPLGNFRQALGSWGARANQEGARILPCGLSGFIEWWSFLLVAAQTSRNSSSGCNPRTTPVPAPALNWDHNHLQNGKFGVCCSIVDDVDLTANGAFAGYRNLQASHLPISNRRPSPKLTHVTSTLFRRNWTMLGAVFVGAFAFELYVAA
jgi:hypothetical protein